MWYFIVARYSTTHVFYIYRENQLMYHILNIYKTYSVEETIQDKKEKKIKREIGGCWLIPYKIFYYYYSFSQVFIESGRLLKYYTTVSLLLRSPLKSRHITGLVFLKMNSNGNVCNNGSYQSS